MANQNKSMAVELSVTTDSSQGLVGGDSGREWGFATEKEAFRFAETQLNISPLLWVEDDEGEFSFSCGDTDRHGSITK